MYSLRVISPLLSCVLLPGIITGAQGLNLLLTNDDGWATAQERATFSALEEAGFDLLLSCPADNKSGTGSSSSTPGPRDTPCEFSTCPAGSPPEGSNSTDPRFNWVNGFPVDSVRFGIQTLAPMFFGGNPDFVVSGPNVGANAGSTVLISGTVGAATEAALEGIPSVAFSGPSGSQVSYTTLDTDPTSSSSVAALVYGQLTTKFVDALLLDHTQPFLPSGILLNVNFPSTSSCADPASVEFILTRINAADSSTPPDVSTCGSTRLPTESSTFTRTDGCFASVSVMNSANKGDVDAATQEVVLGKLSGFLSCLPS